MTVNARAKREFLPFPFALRPIPFVVVHNTRCIDLSTRVASVQYSLTRSDITCYMLSLAWPHSVLPLRWTLSRAQSFICASPHRRHAPPSRLDLSRVRILPPSLCMLAQKLLCSIEIAAAICRR